MNFTKTVSCVTRYMDRFYYLKQALPTWLIFPYDEIIIVDWSSKDNDLVPYIRELNDARIKIVQVPEQQYFNQGASWNTGVRYASSEFIQGIDCDTIFFPRAYEHVLPIEDNKFYTGLPNTHTHGTALFSKSAWTKVSGFTEIFKTWSQDDVLFYKSLEQAGYRRELSFTDYEIKHIDHDDTIRFKHHEIKMSQPDAINYNIQEELKSIDKVKGMKIYAANVYGWKNNEFVCSA